MKCELCDGSGRIYTDNGWGLVIEPCPNCNEAYKLAEQRKFEEATKVVKTPDWVRQAFAEILN